MMKRRWLLLCLLLAVLSLAGCGGKTPPAEEPPKTPAVQPEEDTEPEETLPEELPPEDATPELPPLAGTPLTEEEVAKANQAFSVYGTDNEKALELACFFTSFYEDVTELNLEEFLRYYFTDNHDLTDEDQEEFQALAALPGFPWDAEDLERWGNVPSGLPVPVHRIPKAAVDRTLETYAGITTTDLKNTNGILYLSDYDSYYNFTSDYGPGFFEAVEGARDGDTVRLRSEASWWGEGGETVRELTLREEDGRWLIQSFTSFPVGDG